jgi:hypothetical protein
MAASKPWEPKPPMEITITIPNEDLRRISDAKLALYWHLAQANPAPYADKDACELTTRLTYEIIRRWLGKVEPPLYHHQPRDHYWHNLTRFAKWVDGEWQAKDQAPVDGNSPDAVHALIPGMPGTPRCAAPRTSRVTLVDSDVTCRECRALLAGRGGSVVEKPEAPAPEIKHALQPDGSEQPRCGAPSGSRIALFAGDVTCSTCQVLLNAQLAEYIGTGPDDQTKSTNTEPPGDAP